MAQHNYSVSLDDIKKMFPDSSESTNEDPSKDIVFTLIQKHLATLQSQQFNHSLIQQLQQQVKDQKKRSNLKIP